MKPRRSLDHPNGGALVIGFDAPAVRRRVGPLAWCVLESVVAASDTDGVAPVSIRSVAAELGVGKNTVHRATTTLRDTGLVLPVAARSSSGRFASGAYRVSVAPVAIKRVEGAAAVPTPHDPANTAHASSVDRSSPSRPRRRPPRPSAVGQLSLLPEV